MLQVCICAHNPRLAIFERVLRSLARQTCGPEAFELLIVDNASDPPISEAECHKILGPDISLRIEREERLGNAHARARAVGATIGEWILFVDDDNELMPDYVEQGLRVIRENPGFGCFGGKLLLPDSIEPGPWVRFLLPFLAIKDVGEEPITACVRHWGIWEPPTAGAFVRRPVLERYLAVMQSSDTAHRLGRKGRHGLSSGEDSLMMRGAHALGLSTSYQPALRLTHHLDPKRFRFRYLMRLMHSYGRSQVILDQVLRQGSLSPSEEAIPFAVRALRGITQGLITDAEKSWKYACCMLAFRIGYVREQRNRTARG